MYGTHHKHIYEGIMKPVSNPKTVAVAMTLHPTTRNQGKHLIHTSGQYDSHMLLPMIPKQSILQPV